MAAGLIKVELQGREEKTSRVDLPTIGAKVT
jgi:hypothetical protein